jgi:hypothetical protein
VETVFISWSGSPSKEIATLLARWLKDVFVHGIDIWISTDDIDPGTRWSKEVAEKLERASIGILCLTNTNKSAPWILFEAGALSKVVDKSRVIPYLLDIKPSEIEFPLAQFHGVEANKYGTMRLVESINFALDTPIDHEQISRQFDKWWGDFEQERQHIFAEPPRVKQQQRAERDLLEEILALLRSSDIGTTRLEVGPPVQRTKLDSSQQELSTIIRKVRGLFPALTEDAAGGVLQSLAENNRTQAVNVVRQEMGKSIKEAWHIVNTIIRYVSK